MAPSPPPFRINPQDAQYQADAVAEGKFFDKPQYFSTRLAIALPSDAPLEAHANRRLTGDPRTRWFELIARHGPFRNGLFFGVTDADLEARILELNPGLSVTFLDISEESLTKRRDMLGARFPGRIQTRVADLNFSELEADAYDVIISMSTLHHLQNIEWAAYQINRALKPGGSFFLNDYVGEDRFQFRAERKAIMQAILDRGKRQGDLPQSWAINWPVLDPWVFSPFEAIRCADTLDVLSQHLDPVHVRGTGALSALLVIVSMSAEDQRRYVSVQEHVWRRHPHALPRRIASSLGFRRKPAMSRRFQSEIMLLDGLSIDSGLLSPLVAFGIYHKRV